jgi:hypothetical protein
MSRRLRLASVVVAAAAAACLAVAGSDSAESPPAPAVAVSPLPGTPDASPTTQISFLGPSGTHVASVRVVGSQSGTHSGRLEAYSTGTGESFLPSSHFTSGETVRVTARVAVGGTTRTVSTSFGVTAPLSISKAEFPNKPGDAAAVQHYRSAPQITPSTVRVTTPAKKGATPGDFFLAPYQGTGTPGQMIVDQTGSLVWFHPLVAGESSTNFRVQRYRGKPVLTWWQGRILKLGFGQGVDEIYGTDYHPIAHVLAGNGYHADLHEFLLTPQGTAWIDEFNPVPYDLAAVHSSSNAQLNDSIVQEIDVRTGLVMWEWHAAGHIPLADSNNGVSPASYPWDFAHVNSVDPGSSGDVLLSARNSWAIYDVDMRTGAFRWQIGGRHSTFQLGPGVTYYWQHDAEWQPGRMVSVFDNGSTPPKERESRGLLLALDGARHTVTLVKQFTNPNATLLAAAQGNLLRLPAGNWLMGYGNLPNFTEYDGSGHVLFDAALGPNVQDFRTYLAPWSGHPTTRPSVAAQAGPGGAVTVEASWNGATDVRSWHVLAGSSAGSLKPVATVARDGFETTATVHTSARRVAVAAVDAGGRTLATSAAIAPTR